MFIPVVRGRGCKAKGIIDAFQSYSTLGSGSRSLDFNHTADESSAGSREMLTAMFNFKYFVISCRLRKS